MSNNDLISREALNYAIKEIGCTQCPYAGHIELKECPDAYTEVSQYCGLYNHVSIEQKGGAE